MIPIIEDGILPLDGKVKFPEIRVHETKTGHVADTLINGKWKYFTYDGIGVVVFKVPSYLKKIIPKEVKREGFNQIPSGTSPAFFG